jgi:hypothetical protein
MTTKNEFSWPEPHKATGEERKFNKRVSDRKILLDHVDYVMRPPVWVYEDIEAAIARVNADDSSAVVETGEGKMTAQQLMEIWEIEEHVLEAYARLLEHEDYD